MEKAEILCKECGAIYTGERSPKECVCKGKEFEVIRIIAS